MSRSAQLAGRVDDVVRTRGFIVGVVVPGGGGSHLLHLDGSTADVVDRATERELSLLLDALERSWPSAQDGA
ncbi:hypothetical protein [Ornithinimicrobium cerasi]|uniref:Uncharacterized protein n=1 Tax=Ornithinimicrobium cerasi TaxID=2248773 RepID=A0A285VJE1_9MICO|nr:hypothetical protein [Ornithinimicrobium cerasi]SOC54205.1 hypothetical protein SAMN05421879_1037 [Ornithinimicrobium cerasi]